MRRSSTRAYAAVSRIMQGREVIIRTLDGRRRQGGLLPQDGRGAEPVFGLARHPVLPGGDTDLYKTQLRALLRAGAQYRNIKIICRW